MPRGSLLSQISLALVVVFLVSPVAVTMYARGNSCVPEASSPRMDEDRNRIFDNLDLMIANSSSDEFVEVIATLNCLAPTDYLSQLRPTMGDVSVGFIFSIVPGFSARLSASQIQALAQSPWIRQIEWDAPVEVAMDTASKWFGIQKARVDFAVDGNADGKSSYSSSDIVIAVLDTGIDTSHVDLDGGKVIGWTDIHGDFWGTRHPTPYDDMYHGTHVASIAAGEGQGNPIYRGVAPGAALVGVKVIDWRGQSTQAKIDAGIDWVVANKATYGIRVMSLSIGIPNTAPSDGTDSTSLKVNAAWDAGIVVTVAAGNNGPGTSTIGSPGAASKVITVGAMADPGEGGFYLWWKSSRGPTRDGRIKPDVLAPGVSIAAAAKGTGNGYRVESGTSMATPFVAGTVALMLQRNPSLLPNQVKSGLAGEDWGPTFPDVDYGIGRLLGYDSVRGVSAGSPPGTPAHISLPNRFVSNGGSVSWFVPMTDVSTPVAATLLQTKTCIGLEIRFNGQVVAGSHGNDRQDTVAAFVGNRGMYEIRVMDDSWFRDCGSSFHLDISHRFDDWNSFRDAGNSFYFALAVSITTGTGGYLTSSTSDQYDWFQTYVASGRKITVTMTPLQGRNHDLELYDPSAVLKAASRKGPGLTDSITFQAGVSGYWRILVYSDISGQQNGVYTISLSVCSRC